MADAVPLARHVIVGDEARSGEVRVAGVAHGLFVPQFPGGGSALLAVSIVGATVMPHVIYLHSSLTDKRIVGASPAARRTIFRFEIVDITLAMGIAGVVNLAMLATAAAVFHSHGLPGAGDDLSQVFLSFGIPFALVPLLFFTSSAKIMGTLVNRRPTIAAASLVTAMIVALNLYLLVTV